MSDPFLPDDDAVLAEHDLAAWQPAGLSEDFEDRVMAQVNAPDVVALHASHRSTPPGGVAAHKSVPRSSSRGWLLAAAAAVLVGGGVLYGVRSTSSVASDVTDQSAAIEGVAWLLEDGGQVHWDGGRAVQTEGRVRYTVEAGTPFVVETKAATITVGGTEFTVEVMEMSADMNGEMKQDTKRKLQAVGALAMGAAAVAVYVHSGSVEVSNQHGAVALESAMEAVASEGSAPRRVDAAAEKALERTPQIARRMGFRKLAPQERRRVIEQISRAVGGGRSSAVGASDEPTAPREEEPTGNLDKDYIRAIVSEDLVPLAKECYENALEKTPGLGGKLILEFSIAGDKSVGGIVETVALGEESTLTDPDLRECISESTSSLLFDPPKGGGRVIVSYPIVFEPGPDDEGDEDPALPE